MEKIKETKWVVFDNDSKEPVTEPLSFDEAQRLCEETNRICKDAGGSSTQYGIDHIDKF